MFNLKDRVTNYITINDYKLMEKLPIIICVNGRAFSKATSLLDKPYCTKFAESMLSTTVKLCMEVDGSIFAYQYNDEIVLVLRNDQKQNTNPWYNNKLQKICSATASIATQHFNMFSSNIGLNIMGDALFTSQVFCTPNIQEAINAIIYKQQHNFHISIQLSCFYELIKKYDKNTIQQMLSDLNMDEKIDLLKQECDIDFNEYNQSFRRGSACYKSPKIIDGSIKNKWIINTNLPVFTKDTQFLSNIFKMGHDVFRNPS